MNEENMAQEVKEDVDLEKDQETNLSNDSEINAEQSKETDEKLSNLTEEEKLNNEKKEIQDKYLRLYSEFDNYKKRTTKERIDLFKTANQEVLSVLLPVLDDLNRTIASFENISDPDSMKEGIDLVYNKFINILEQQGLKEIEAIGKEFNTDYHEAITKVPAKNKKDKGKVIDVIEKGYFLNEKVLRYAKVVVGS
ncbi:nucleotide exchange factor GrpE [Cytophagaceae bacterium AH-315-L13]|nr:nucleotide exchange factor GrpE [Cytophagaceae bacterium AH-315-L13]